MATLNQEEVKQKKIGGAPDKESICLTFIFSPPWTSRATNESEFAHRYNGHNTLMQMNSDLVKALKPIFQLFSLLGFHLKCTVCHL